MIEDKNDITFLMAYAEASGMSLDFLLSLYLVIGEDLYFVLSLLQKQTITFPSLKPLKKEFSTPLRFLELKSKRYRVQMGWKNVFDLEIGDIIDINGVDYPVLLPVREILGHYYLPLFTKKEG